MSINYGIIISKSQIYYCYLINKKSYLVEDIPNRFLKVKDEFIKINISKKNSNVQGLKNNIRALKNEVFRISSKSQAVNRFSTSSNN